MVYMAEFECAIFLQTFLSINTGTYFWTKFNIFHDPNAVWNRTCSLQDGFAGKTVCVRSKGKMLQPAQNVK